MVRQDFMEYLYNQQSDTPTNIKFNVEVKRK